MKSVLRMLEIDENSYVYATLQGNTYGKVPVVGFITTHMDTSPDMTGTDVKPRISGKTTMVPMI